MLLGNYWYRHLGIGIKSIFCLFVFVYLAIKMSFPLTFLHALICIISNYYSYGRSHFMEHLNELNFGKSKALTLVCNLQLRSWNLSKSKVLTMVCNLQLRRWNLSEKQFFLLVACRHLKSLKDWQVAEANLWLYRKSMMEAFEKIVNCYELFLKFLTGHF